MGSFRFLHAADVHLDGPLKGLAGQEGSAAERIRTACSDAELQAMMTDVESDLVERKETFDGDAPRTVREAITS